MSTETATPSPAPVTRDILAARAEEQRERGLAALERQRKVTSANDPNTDLGQRVGQAVSSAESALAQVRQLQARLDSGIGGGDPQLAARVGRAVAQSEAAVQRVAGLPTAAKVSEVEATAREAGRLAESMSSRLAGLEARLAMLEGATG